MFPRLVHIVSSGSRNYLPAAFNFLLSALVVRYTSVDLWGEFIIISVTINLFSQIGSWGHQVPLIRDFTNFPKSINNDWYTSVFTRTGLLILPILYFLFIDDQNISLEVALAAVFLQTLLLSLNTLIVYHQKFKEALLVDIIGYSCFVGIVLLSQKEISLGMLFLGLIGQLLIRTLGYLICVRKAVFPMKIRFSWHVLIKDSSFFLIALAAFLNARITILIIQYFVKEDIIGTFHIVTLFLLQGKALSGMLLSPFSRQLLRLPKSAYINLLKRMIGFGFIISVVLSLLIPIVVQFVYNLSIPVFVYPSLCLFILSGFIETPIIYWFFRSNQEKRVLRVGYVGIAIHVLLLLLFSIDIDLLRLLYIFASAKMIIALIYLFTFISKRNANKMS